MRIATAAALYFAIVFGVGFLLGPIRVLWLEPRLGPIIATACEAPILLAAMAVAARAVVRRLGLQGQPLSLLLMGAGALVLQQIADLAVGVVLRGISPSRQLAQLATPEGMIYTALLIALVLMPVLLHGRRPEPARPATPGRQAAMH